MELKSEKKFGKLLVILQNYLTVKYRKLPVNITGTSNPSSNTVTDVNSKICTVQSQTQKHIT